MNWSDIFRMAWMVLLSLGGILEIAALVFNIDGGTLSELIWDIRDANRRWFGLLMFLLLWAIYHFVWDDPARPVEGGSDGIPLSNGGGGPPSAI